MAKSLKQLTQIVDNFGDKRNWLNNDPNQLIASIIIELGELAEHYQWQNQFKKYTKTEKLEIGYEFVDVLVYLLRLASKSDIDLEKYFDSKMKKLEIKFPLGINEVQYFKQHKKYRKNGKSKRYE